MDIALALLLFPGLLATLALGALFGLLAEGRVPLGWLARPTFLGNADGLAGLLSVLLTVLAMALLPWPLHPAPRWGWIINPLLLWSAVEMAFLLPLLPALLSPAPFAARAASRELQIGAAGRCVLWLAIGAALWQSFDWSPAMLAGCGVLLLAGLLALPAAAALGPFSPERNLSSAGSEEGLDESTAGLLRFARLLRAAALLAALILAVLDQALAQAAVQPPIVLTLILAWFVVVALVLRQIGPALPRLTLPGALRWCWWRALPLALAGVLVLRALAA